jgi:hypothetical protein
LEAAKIVHELPLRPEKQIVPPGVVIHAYRQAVSNSSGVVVQLDPNGEQKEAVVVLKERYVADSRCTLAGRDNAVIGIG